MLIELLSKDMVSNMKYLTYIIIIIYVTCFTNIWFYAMWNDANNSPNSFQCTYYCRNKNCFLYIIILACVWSDVSFITIRTLLYLDIWPSHLKWKENSNDDDHQNIISINNTSTISNETSDSNYSTNDHLLMLLQFTKVNLIKCSEW